MLVDDDPIREIATVIGVIAQDNTLSVQLNEDGASCIDWNTKRILISDRCVPKCYRVHPTLVRYFRLALAQHEAQHWAFMKGMVDKYNTWVESRRYPILGTMAINIVDDYRGNTWLEESYIDIGTRITWMNRAMLKAWKPQLAKVLRKTVKDANKGDAKSQDFLENPVNFVIHGSIMCAILQVTPEDFANEWSMWTGYYPPDASIEAVRKVAELSWESKYQSRDTIFETYHEVYRIFETHTNQKWKKKQDGQCEVQPVYRSPQDGQGGRGGFPVIDITKIPVNYGGQAEVEGQKNDALKEAGELGKAQKESEGDQYQAHAGKGAGSECPTPEPDEGSYQRLVARTMPYVTALLNRMKKLMQPRLEMQKYQRSGKLMTKMLGKYITQRRPVENLYQRKRFILEKQKVALSLIVDVSGSMRTEDARNVLTVIAEVGGKWLNDEDLAIMVFGGEYQKIKSFVEPYRQTRARIGGVDCLGGTMLAECLDATHRMYRSSVAPDKQRICVICSDFCLGDPDETKKRMKEMRKDGIEFIGVGMCAGDLHSAKEYCDKNSTYIRDVSELPALFYEIYRRATT